MMASDLRRLFAAVAAIAAVMAGSAEAKALDGNRLYDLCRPNSRSSEFCDDYVMNIAERLMVGRVAGWTACIPTHLTDDHVVDAAKQFLEAHPARRRSAALGLVAEALAKAFPCK
jgi:hypothetical protein